MSKAIRLCKKWSHLSALGSRLSALGRLGFRIRGVVSVTGTDGPPQSRESALTCALGLLPCAYPENLKDERKQVPSESHPCLSKEESEGEGEGEGECLEEEEWVVVEELRLSGWRR